MPGIIGHKSIKHRRNRRTNNTPAKATPISVTSAVVAMTTVTLTFDQAVSLKGIPQYARDGGEMPSAAIQSTASVIVLTYTGAVVVSVEVPFQDPAVRNSSGGYVNPGGLTIA